MDEQSGNKNRIRVIPTKGGMERSRVLRSPDQYIKMIEKIPAFTGVSFGQFMRILELCVKQEYAAEEQVCAANRESNQLYILITGKLRVVSAEGRTLAELKPGATVGEMGVFTGDLRSASVYAAVPSVALVLQRIEMMNLFRRDGELGLIILTNIIRDLSRKVRDANEAIQALKLGGSPSGQR